VAKVIVGRAESAGPSGRRCTSKSHQGAGTKVARPGGSEQRKPRHSGALCEMRVGLSWADGQRLVAVDPPESLPKAFVGHLERLATNPYACRVVQKMFEQMPEEMKRPLLDEMHPLVGTLMQDQFGSKCRTRVAGCADTRLRRAERDRHGTGTRPPAYHRPSERKHASECVLAFVARLMSVSRHKFASNVCEKALQHAEPEDRRILVDEVIDAQEDEITKIPMLLRDAFGNFPLQVCHETPSRKSRSADARLL